MPAVGAGYAVPMSDQTPQPGQPAPDAPDTGHDVSTPPGVPEREDRSQPGLAADTRTDQQAADSVEDSHAGTIDVQDEQATPDTRSEETPEQRENTEASTEQPSQ